MDKNDNEIEQGAGLPEQRPEPETDTQSSAVRQQILAQEQQRRHRLKVIITTVAFVVLFAGGIGGGYFFFQKTTQKAQLKPVAEAPRHRGSETEVVVFFPAEGRLKSETREISAAISRSEIAKATVEEFLKGPGGNLKSYVPEGARLLGIYDGADGILYVDISDSFRRNLQVDAMAEFLLMRGLYESLLANVYGVGDVKILIEGAEVETLGGHISIRRPLGETVAQTIVEE